MGKPSRDKGARTERECVKAFQNAGLAAERIPLSGATWLKGDITVPLLNHDRRIEVKCRAKGFRQVYAWLEGNYALIVKADRSEPLIVMPLKEAARIAAVAEKFKDMA